MLRIKNTFLFAALAGVTLLSSCAKDDEAPTISFDTAYTIGNKTVEPGDSVTFGVIATSGTGDLVELEISQSYDGGTATVLETITLSGESASETYTIGTRTIEGTEKYTFTVVDKNDLTAEVSSTITTKSAGTALATEVTTGKFYHIEGRLEGAYDLVADAVKSSSDADADKDMVNNDMAAATFTGSWQAGTGNGTKFVRDNSYDYDNATVESAETAYNAGTNPDFFITSPASGDIYIAKLRGGTDYAVIKITKIDAADNTCSCANTGIIEFSYKKK